jgi:pyridoxal phosphate enzyme (YggS family)
VDVAEDPRRRELAASLTAVRARIAAACARARRDPTEVTLVAVTKTWPASDVVHLAALGVTDFGENRDQEAAPKAADVAACGVAVRWHFVGRLQRNKCRSVVGYADLVHSVDWVSLATTVAEAAIRYRGLPLDVLVQVSIDGDPHRGGAGRGLGGDVELSRVLDAVASSEALGLRGLMAVAPQDWEPKRAFAILAQVAAETRDMYPSARLLSAGMSNDVEEAIDYGATHVRLGSALLGNRATLL